ncbi:MAG: hypothetical protein ACM4AI_01560 [Acidobacteriota bacterium]
MKDMKDVKALSFTGTDLTADTMLWHASERRQAAKPPAAFGRVGW